MNEADLPFPPGTNQTSQSPRPEREGFNYYHKRYQLGTEFYLASLNLRDFDEFTEDVQ